MAASTIPTKFWVVLPAVDSTTSVTLTRYTTLADAERAALVLSLCNSDAVYVTMEATHYTDAPLDDAVIDPLVVAIP